MGFDKNSSQPIIQTTRKATQVNLAMAGAIFVFLALGVAAIFWMVVKRGA